MIKQFLLLCSILFLAITLSGCAATQPVDEDSDVGRSGRKHRGEGISIRSLFGNANKGRGQVAPSDPKYQEYQDWKEWQEFQEYKKWKVEQGEGEETN